LEKALYENVDSLTETIIEAADDRRYDIRRKLIDSLPFGTKWMLEGKVRDIVDEVFDYTLPEFVYEKKEEFLRILSKVLNYSLADLGIDDDVLNQEKLQEVFYKIYESNGFKKGMISFVASFINVVMMIKLIEILKLLNIRNLRNLVDMFEPVIRDALDVTVQNIEKKQNELIMQISIFLESVLKELFKNKNFMYLLEGVDKNDINKVLSNLLKDEKFQKEFLVFLEDVLIDFFSRDFFDKGILKNDLEFFIVKDLNSEKYKEIFIPFIDRFFKNLNILLDEKLKEEITDDFVKALFLAIRKNLDVIIKSIDIKEVIQREINEMHPKEIEEMFYSFAGGYFKKLKMYGAIGAVFGVPSMFI